MARADTIRRLASLALLIGMLAGCSAVNERPINTQSPPASYSGVWRTWYPGGRDKYRQCAYQNGKLNGSFVEWHLNGQKQVVAQYKNDERVGVGREFYDDGTLGLEMHYSEGKLHGTQTWWFKNGKKEKEENYKNGKRDGVSKQWDYYDGKLRVLTCFRAGKHDGAMTEWYENGQKYREINYRAGERHGTSTYWDEKANIIKLEHYNMGKLMRDKKGAPNKELKATR